MQKIKSSFRISKKVKVFVLNKNTIGTVKAIKSQNSHFKSLKNATMKIIHYLAQFRLSRYSRILFVLSDIVVLNLSIILSTLFRWGSLDRLQDKSVATINLVINIVWIFLLLSRETLRKVRVEPIERIIHRLIGIFLVHISFIMFFIILLKYSDISRLKMLYFYYIFFTLLLISRITYLKLLQHIRKLGYNFRTVVIIGANEVGEQIHQSLVKDLSYGYKVLGFFSDEITAKTITAPLLGFIIELEEYLQQNKVNEMYVALRTEDASSIPHLQYLCEKYMVRIKFVPDFSEYTKASRVEIVFYDNVPVLTFRREPLEYPVNRILKRIFDISFSLCVILLIVPWLFPILALMIKMGSPGPVFFKQQRSGLDNDAFYCYKFRSMTVNKAADKRQAQKGDARITKLGAILRKTSLDEMPQFFNVLAGQMSVVGPRPHMVSHTEEYSKLINNYLVRHLATPGITGWAQINGCRGETKELKDMKKRVDHDIWYIENWSFLLDLKIVYLTVVSVFKGDEKAF